MTTVLASAHLFDNPDGTLSGLGTVMAWFLGIPFALAFFAGVILVLFGWGPAPRRRR